MAVIADSKLTFAKRRYAETLLGGIKLFTLSDFDEKLVMMSKSLVTLQLLIMVAPAVVAAICIYGLNDKTTSTIIFGSVLFIETALLRMASRTKNSISDIEFGKPKFEMSIFDTPTNDSIRSLLLKSTTSGLVGSEYMYSMMSGNQHSYLTILCMLPMCMAQYSIAVRAPQELAAEMNQSVYTRMFYLALFLIPLRASWWLALLPFLWSVGLAPGPWTLIEWGAEQVNTLLFGDSCSGSAWRTAIRTIASLVGASIPLLFLATPIPVIVGVSCFTAGCCHPHVFGGGSKKKKVILIVIPVCLATASSFVGTVFDSRIAGWAMIGVWIVMIYLRRSSYRNVLAWMGIVLVSFIVTSEKAVDQSSSFGVVWLLFRAFRVLSNDSPIMLVVEVIASYALLQVTSLNFLALHLICGITRDRVIGFLERFQFAKVHTLSVSTDDKLKHPYASIIWLPTVNLLSCIIAAVIDSPVIPLLGTCVFIVGHPRPKRMWNDHVHTTVSSTDSALYQQVSKYIVNIFQQQQLYRGQSSVFLVRFEKMLAFVNILEAEYGSMAIQIRGVELQEQTSCHGVEANELDRLIEEKVSVAMMQPLFQTPITTYSHSASTLTGVLDNTEFQKLVAYGFSFTMTWLLAKTKIQLESKIPDYYDNCTYSIEWEQFLKGTTTVASCANGPSGPHGDDFDLDDLLDEMDFSAPILAAPSATAKTTIKQVSPESRSEMEHLVRYLCDQVHCNNSMNMTDLFNKKLHRKCSWLESQQELIGMVFDAYRLAWKLSLDAYLIGDPDPTLTDFKAINKCLNEYQQDWYLGNPSEPKWVTSVLNERQSMLAITGDKKMGGGEFLQLTLDSSQIATVCALNPAMVRGLWANLQLELLYFTNDDDERYSCQANKLLFRNLIIQAAEPPLGYPVYSGELTDVYNL